jgi:MFS family permease
MYLSLRNAPATEDRGGRVRAAVPRTVLLLGFTSLFTDISSEMVLAVLPLYLTLQLGLSPLAFGFIDGLYQGVSAVSRLGAGVLSDRLGRPKAVAAVGYGLSAATRPLLLMAQSVTGMAALVSVDRIGKGIRTAPRDAMIAAASPMPDLGRNFGVHRSMDNFGAMLGPLLAFGLLILLPYNYDAVFVVSTAFALIGLAVLLLLVPSGFPTRPGAVAPPRLTRHDVLDLLQRPEYTRRLLVAGAATVFTVSDAFLFLTLLQRDDALARAFPLFPVGVALVYMVLAVPVGRLADRVGRTRVYLTGHLLVLATYALVASAVPVPVAVVGTLVLMGCFYAATDGVLSAMVAPTLPDAVRTSGLALAQTVVALAALVSSVMFGVLLHYLGTGFALTLMATGLVAAVMVGVRVLPGVAGTMSRSHE